MRRVLHLAWYPWKPNNLYTYMQVVHVQYEPHMYTGEYCVHVHVYIGEDSVFSMPKLPSKSELINCGGINLFTVFSLEAEAAQEF